MTAVDTAQQPNAGARRAARNAGAIAAARILSSGAQFLWQIVLAAQLGESDFGVYGAVGALFSIGVTVASFSIGLIVIRDIARDPSKADRMWGAALWVQTIATTIAYVGLFAVGTGYSDTIRAFTAIACLSLFIDIFGSHCYDQLLAQERMVTTSIVEVGFIALRLTLAAALLAAGFGLLGVYAATIVTGVVRSGLLAVLLWRTGVRPLFPIDRAVVRRLLIDSTPLTVYAFINITYAQIDKLLTSRLLGDAETGHLTAAFVIVAGAVEILSTTVLTAVFPMLSRMADERDGETFRFTVEKLAFFTLLVGVPMGVIVSIAAPALIVPVLGPSYAATADILRALIWYAAVVIVSNVFAQAMFAANRQRRTVVYRVVGLAIKLIVGVIALSTVGVVGAAVASLIAELVVLAIFLVDFRFDLQRFAPRLARLSLVAVGMAIVLITLSRAIGTIPAVVIAGVGYLIAVVMARVPAPDDWDLLYRLVTAMPGGGLITRVWRRTL